MKTKDQILLENLYSNIILKEMEENDFFKGNVIGKKLYDSEGRITFDGYDTYYEYPDNGDKVRYDQFNKYIWNKNRTLIYKSSQRSTKGEEVMKFNEYGKIIYHKHPNGSEEITKYDDKGKIVYYKVTGENESKREREEFYEYKDDGAKNKTIRFPDGTEAVEKYKHGSLIYSKAPDGTEEFREYYTNDSYIRPVKTITTITPDGKERIAHYFEGGALKGIEDEKGITNFEYFNGKSRVAFSKTKNDDKEQNIRTSGKNLYVWNKRILSDTSV